MMKVPKLRHKFVELRVSITRATPTIFWCHVRDLFLARYSFSLTPGFNQVNSSFLPVSPHTSTQGIALRGGVRRPINVANPLDKPRGPKKKCPLLLPEYLQNLQNPTPKLDRIKQPR